MTKLSWAIVAAGLAAAFFWKQSKGPSWRGWNKEIFAGEES